MSRVYTDALAAKRSFEEEKYNLIMSHPSLPQLLDLLLGIPIYSISSPTDTDIKSYAFLATRRRVAEKIASGELLRLLIKLEESK